jgi:hypothetical protein
MWLSNLHFAILNKLRDLQGAPLGVALGVPTALIRRLGCMHEVINFLLIALASVVAKIFVYGQGSKTREMHPL